jgi:hypothetical protein
MLLIAIGVVITLLESVEGIEAYRAYYLDTGQKQLLAGIEKMSPFWRKFVTSGSWWRLSSERRGVHLQADELGQVLDSLACVAAALGGKSR